MIVTKNDYLLFSSGKKIQHAVIGLDTTHTILADYIYGDWDCESTEEIDDLTDDEHNELCDYMIMRWENLKKI